jgi:hypothetical protein
MNTMPNQKGVSRSMNRPRALAAVLTLAMICAWTNRSQAGTRGPGQKAYKLAIPGKNWAVEIKLPSSFSIESPEVSPDGERAKLSGSEEATGLQLSLFLEKAPTEGDAAAARDFYWKRMQASPLKMEDVRFSEKNGAAILEYIVKEISWKNANLYLSHDGYWADLHLSKMLFRDADQGYFETILNSVRIVSTERGSQVTAGSAKPYSVKLPQHGKLILNVPSSWKRSLNKANEELPPTIVLSPGKGNAFETMITPIWSPDNAPNFNNAAALKWVIGQHLKKMLATAVEKEIPIQEFKAVDGPGYYFLVTDKAPKPGEYPYAVVALVGVGDLILNVTILCKDKASDGIAATIQMLQEARQEK